MPDRMPAPARHAEANYLTPPPPMLCRAARCVIVLGMPYPNPSDPELQERMRYLDAAAAAAPAAASPPGGASAASAAAAAPGPQPGPRAAAQALTGAQLYEDLCFKAVNQAVGRVIRHRGDYAAIVLADQRWVAPAGAAAAPGAAAPGARGRAPPAAKLPAWIRRSFAATPGEFGAAYRALAGFYRAHKALPAGAEPSAVAAASTTGGVGV
jgi:chromosome transmission fidelity protein 1